MQLLPEDQLILSSIKINPNQSELNHLNGLILQVVNWDYFIQTIVDRGIGPLFYKKIALLSNSSLIPTEHKNKLQQSYYKTLTRSMVLYNAFRTVMEALNAHNLKVIALKGIYLSEWLYQDIGLRQFSDIDLLVNEDDGLVCLDILTNLGYKPIEDNRSEFLKKNSEILHYIPMSLNAVIIELHLKIHRNTGKYFVPVESLWKNAIFTTINNTPIYTLNEIDLLIHLCLHLDKHFQEGHVQFTCFNDITNLLEKLGTSLNWSIFIERCETYNCKSIVLKYILLVNKYMNAYVPSLIVDKYSIYLVERDENLFYEYLKGYSFTGSSSTVSSHIKDLQHIENNFEKIQYVFENIFPPKAFMLQKYNLSDKRLVISDKQSVVGRKHNYKLQTKNYKQKFWWLWYPYRWWVGLKGLIKLIMNN